MKKKLTLFVDESIIKYAKENKINISKHLEESMMYKYNLRKITEEYVIRKED